VGVAAPAAPEMDLCFISRGRGRGHAMPDLDLIRELKRLCPALSVGICSYGTGAAVFRNAGEDVADLGLADTASVWDIQVAIGRHLRQRRAASIVIHEEFIAVPLARAFTSNVIYLTHWFHAPGDLMLDAVSHARVIGFMESAGRFLLPSSLETKVRYLQPLVRSLSVNIADRPSVRAQMNIDEDEFVVGVFPGSWPESTTPIFTLVLTAFDMLDEPKKRLLWFAGADAPYIATRFAPRSNITVCADKPPIEYAMLASDIAITKGTYNVRNELRSLERRSIALSFGKNPVDDYYAKDDAGCVVFYASETTPTSLMIQIGEARRATGSTLEARSVPRDCVANIAHFILDELSG